jgi:hypothetical protein
MTPAAKNFAIQRPGEHDHYSINLCGKVYR